MIAGLPKLEDNGLYRVRIIDSTTVPHANDTRTKKSVGVGAGVMWLSADKHGNLNGFKNNESSSVSTKNTLAVGRILKVTGTISPLHIADRDYLQLKLNAAKSLAKNRKLKSRVIAEDGESHSVTRKVEMNRVNFVIKKGHVIRVTRG